MFLSKSNQIGLPQCLHMYRLSPTIFPEPCMTHLMTWHWWHIIEQTVMLWTAGGNYIDVYMHNDVRTWTHFPYYWPFVQGIHQLLVDSLHKESVMQNIDVFFVVHPHRLLHKHSCNNILIMFLRHSHCDPCWHDAITGCNISYRYVMPHTNITSTCKYYSKHTSLYLISDTCTVEFAYI